MNLICKNCSARFRAAIPEPLARPVRLICPSCSRQMVLRPVDGRAPATAPPSSRRRRFAIVADEPRPFRDFLEHQLDQMGFEVRLHDEGTDVFDMVEQSRADLVVLNVYLRGKLGVEISEEIRRDPLLKETKIVLIGALFRANRFRANPTNLYGADEYIEDQIPAQELRQIVHGLFPDVGSGPEVVREGAEFEEARRLARLILSDIVIYHPERADRGIQDGSFFDLLQEEIDEGRQYFDERVPLRVRQATEIFNETLQQFVQMKRDEMQRTGTNER